MASKEKTIYSCQKCGAQFPKWMGQCGACGAWDALVEEVVAKASANPRLAGYVPFENSSIVPLAHVEITDQPRITTNIAELDRVLGGGIVIGSVTLVGGDPGIGKSTLLLQTLCDLSRNYQTLYVTGEESLQQIAMRAKRLGLPQDGLKLLAETQVERILSLAQKDRPQIIVIDSIQTMYTEFLQSAPGGVGQVRESAAQLVRYAKQNGIALFIVGHVTKEGTLAGPRVLEHMVDCVLYFEGDGDSRYRVVRAVKNRFGAVNELGVFAMTDRGLREVNNPSAIFLANYSNKVSGSSVLVSWEGSRPLLVEVQALVDQTYLANPRRIAVGLDQTRLAMLLACLHRHGGIKTYDQDVFVNVVGGVRITETAADLALAMAVLSSMRNRSLPEGLVVFGEIGLSGEIRPVQSGQERLKAAAKHGFKLAVVPFANAPKKNDFPIEVVAVKSIAEALSVCQ
jgi:DNA repair protein RadA/Sms